MTVITDGGVSAGPAMFGSRTAAELPGQRDAWLKQLDQSQMLLLRTIALASPAADHRAPERDAPGSKEPGSVPLMPSMLPVHGALRTVDVGAEQQDVGSTDSTGPTVPTAGEAGAFSRSNANASASEGHGATKAMVVEDDVSPAWAAEFPNRAGSALAPAGLAASISLGSNALNSAGRDVAGSALVQGVVRSPVTGLGLSLPTEAMPSGTDVQDAAGEVAEHSPAAQGETGEARAEAWQRKLVHVVQDGTEMSVAIRDGALSTAQSTQIVYRLLSDAAGNGLRLRSAIVNGKLIFRAPDASGDGVLSAADVTSSAFPMYKRSNHHGD